VSGTDQVVTRLGNANLPAVLLLHPWWGVTPAVRWWADQLLEAGRRVVLPDLYGGATASTVAEAQALQQEMDREEAWSIVEACADELAADDAPWAAMGFSMGAFLASGLASRGAAGPDELVLFYGGQPPQGEVRTRHVDLHVVPDDPWFESDELTAVEEGFRAAGSELTRYVYDSQGHWFAERGAPGYDAAAESLARERVIARLGFTAG